MRKRLRMKKSVFIAWALTLVILTSVLVSMILLEVTDYGITVASISATIFMVLSAKKFDKRRIFGSYTVGLFAGIIFAKITNLTSFNVAAAAVSSVIVMTLLEFQHPPAIGIAVAMVLNRFPIVTDIVVIAGIFIIVSLVYLLKICFKDPDRLKRFVILEEEKIKWNFKEERGPDYIKLRTHK